MYFNLIWFYFYFIVYFYFIFPTGRGGSGRAKQCILPFECSNKLHKHNTYSHQSQTYFNQWTIAFLENVCNDRVALRKEIEYRESIIIFYKHCEVMFFFANIM